MSEPTLIPLGMNAKLYFGSAGVIATSEIDNAIDVTLSLEADSADVTTRGNKGWNRWLGIFWKDTSRTPTWPHAPPTSCASTRD